MCSMRAPFIMIKCVTSRCEWVYFNRKTTRQNISNTEKMCSREKLHNIPCHLIYKISDIFHWISFCAVQISSSASAFLFLVQLKPNTNHFIFVAVGYISLLLTLLFSLFVFIFHSSLLSFSCSHSIFTWHNIGCTVTHLRYAIATVLQSHHKVISTVTNKRPGTVGTTCKYYPFHVHCHHLFSPLRSDFDSL